MATPVTPDTFETLKALCESVPDDSHGFELGVDWFGVDDWRFALEMALPSEADAIVGVAIVGTTQVASNTPVWVDVTGYMRGVEWERGARVYGQRPETGIAGLTLNSRAFEFAPWNATASAFRGAGDKFEPGLLVRWGVWSPTLVAADLPYINATGDPTFNGAFLTKGWLPQFTGIVESWPEETVGREADRWVDVVLVETTAELAKIDELAQTAPLPTQLDGVFSLDSQRVAKLVEWSGFRYGHLIILPAVPGRVFLTESLMAGNRLTELYLIADSSLKTFRSGKHGGTVYWPRSRARTFMGDDTGVYSPDEFSGNLEYYPVILGHYFPDGLVLASEVVDADTDAVYVADSLRFANDDDVLVNSVNFHSPGSGNTKTSEDAHSRKRYGLRTYKRTDLYTKFASTLQELADHYVDERAHIVRRFDSLQLNRRHGPVVFGAMAALEHDDRLSVRYRPRGAGVEVTATAHVRHMAHRITVTSTSLEWECDLSLDSDQVTTEVLP